MKNKQKITSTLIALESTALERWGNGDPSGFLEICALDVVYFDPYQEMRIDGLETLTQFYKTIWGRFTLIALNCLIPTCSSATSWLCWPSITSHLQAKNDLVGTAPKFTVRTEIPGKSSKLTGLTHTIQESYRINRNQNKKESLP